MEHRRFNGSDFKGKNGYPDFLPLRARAKGTSLILFPPSVFNKKIDQIYHPGDTHKFENPELTQYVFHNIDTPQFMKDTQLTCQSPFREVFLCITH